MTEFNKPPCTHNNNDETRKVGVEIEFAGLEPKRAAKIVHEVFGGEIKEDDPHRYRITGTKLGDFTAELDTQYSHPEKSEFAEGLQIDSEILAQARNKLDDLDENISRIIGDLSGDFVPTEIITPPIALDNLAEIEDLVDLLRKKGAKGTGNKFFYAFGLQFNPELPALDADTIRRHIQAFLLLEGSLRKKADMTMLRKILPYAAPFDDTYKDKVLKPDYTPDLAHLIDDYLEHNPTRNRALDMLPLWAHLDEDRLYKHIDKDVLVNARPTFHYRLPDCKLDDTNWSAAVEWNRWLQVEELAHDKDRLTATIKGWCYGRM